jgi:hypothetical protein
VPIRTLQLVAMSTLESTSAFVSNNTLEPLFTFLQSSYAVVELTWNQIPGSAVVTRYIRSSHRDDPGRTILEILLVLFAVRTLLQSRTRADGSGKNFVKLSEKVLDFLSYTVSILSLTNGPGNRRTRG